MMPRRSFLSLLASISGLGIAGAQATTTPDEKLAKFHEGIVERYPQVRHISTSSLAAMRPEDMVLFDVRKPSEYGVSHLQSAIHIAPDTQVKEFLRDHGDQMVGKTVVFYCSVGERSSKLAQAVMAGETQEGDTSQGTLNHADIVNLEGGIFKWHNEGRPVFNADGPTNKIHPFNRFWGRLLARRDQISR